MERYICIVRKDILDGFGGSRYVGLFIMDVYSEVERDHPIEVEECEKESERKRSNFFIQKIDFLSKAWRHTILTLLHFGEIITILITIRIIIFLEKNDGRYIKTTIHKFPII